MLAYYFLAYASIPVAFVNGLNSSLVVAKLRTALVVSVAPPLLFWGGYYIICYAWVAARLDGDRYDLLGGSTPSAERAILNDLSGASVAPMVLGVLSAMVGVGAGGLLRWGTDNIQRLIRRRERSDSGACQ